MKSLKMERNTTFQVLTREQLKKVIGGLEDDGPSVVRAACSGGSAAWDYFQPVWYITCWDDIDRLCPTKQGNCYAS
jgi:hypothetical protein